MWQSEGVVLAEMDLGPLAAFASVDATNQLVISEFNEIELCARLSPNFARRNRFTGQPAVAGSWYMHCDMCGCACVSGVHTVLSCLRHRRAIQTRSRHQEKPRQRAAGAACISATCGACTERVRLQLEPASSAIQRIERWAGSALPHLHWDWLNLPTSAPELGSTLPHLTAHRRRAGSGVRSAVR